MVSILPAERSPFDLIGAAIGKNLGAVLPGAVQQGYNRGQLQQSLDAIKELANQKDTKPLDLLLATMRAGAGIPGSERYLGALAPEIVKFAQANASQNYNLPGEDRAAINREEFQRPELQGLPGFMQKPGSPRDAINAQTNEFFPTNQGTNLGPGHLPQRATTGQKVPLLSIDEQRARARPLAKEMTDSGIPTTPAQALQMIRDEEESKKLYNAEVDKELLQQKKSQQDYGEKAETYLNNAFKGIKGYENGPTDEMKAIFKKIGEEKAKQGDSEADIDHYLATEAKNFANSIVAAKDSLSAPRTFNYLQRKANGNYKDFESAAADVRQHLKPLLDKGLWDSARNILQDLGYGKEEREMIMNPLSDRSKSVVAQYPSVRTTSKQGPNLFGGIEKERHPDISNVTEALIKLKESESNFSPLLARKALEDKGYNWKEFKEGWNQAIENGMELSDDQKIQMINLDSPPLGVIEKFLHDINLVGR